MQLWFLLAVVFSSSEGRHYYNYPYRSYPQHTTTVQPSYHKSINDVTVVDQKTGIQYNPYSKHHPGRHVCTLYRNVTYPVHTKRVFCKPTYKKYMVRCGNQWCEGVRLVYEKYHKEMVDNTNHTVVDYTCCPGWTQVDYRSHGCNKPVCEPPCLNRGNCVKPNVCDCPKDYGGKYCETRVSTYEPSTCLVETPGYSACPPKICPYCLFASAPEFPCPTRNSCCRNGLQDEPDDDPPPCLAPCRNSGNCVGSKCLCRPGFQGSLCEKDINECKEYKPCDQICHNTHGSYKCDCKENFTLDQDGQTCRSESDEAANETKDLNDERLWKIEKRMDDLEKMIGDKDHKYVARKEVEDLQKKLNKMKNDIDSLGSKMLNPCPCNCKSETQLDRKCESKALNTCPPCKRDCGTEIDLPEVPCIKSVSFQSCAPSEEYDTPKCTCCPNENDEEQCCCSTVPACGHSTNIPPPICHPCKSKIISVRKCHM